MKPPWNVVKTKSSGGGNNLMGSYLPYLIAQQKGAAGQESAPNAVTTGGTNPATGNTFKTPEGQNMEVQETLRKKAGEDALKLSQAMPILDDLEKSYSEAYKNFQGEKSGIKGGLSAGQEYFNGVIMRQNPALRNFIDKSGQYEAPLVKLTGDVGNFSATERESASKGIPKVTPNGDINRMFMPDDIEFGMSKIQSLKQLYSSKYMEALKVAKTGELTEGYKNWINASGSGDSTPDTNNMNVEAERQKAIKLIQSGRYDAKKMADLFRAHTGQELNAK